MLSIGDKYLDYTVTSFIGRGGMGTVLLLENESHEKAALKILHPHLLDDEELVRRFYLEAEVAGRLDCPYVCKVYDVREVSLGERPSHGILMEYIEGESLADMMDETPIYGEEWALHVAEGVLAGLEAIHASGLLHRDIKPENIMITPDDRVMLLDLGLAKVMESSIKLSKTGYFIGTYHYASPEQLTGDDIDYSCDIYSLGTVLYELTTGTRPHTSTDIRDLIFEKINTPVRNPSRLNPTLSPFFDMLVCDMLAIKPANRLRTATRVREIIQARESGDWYKTRVSMSVSIKNISQTTSLRRLIRVPRRTRLYGRYDEFEKLREWADASLGLRKENGATSGGTSVLIGGEAGIGKTRFVEALVTELETDDDPFVILLGRSLVEKRHVPYSPLIEMVRDFFLLDDEPDVDLVELFSEYIPNMRPLIPPFLELVTNKRFMDDSGIRGVLNESNILHLFQTLFTAISKEVPLILFLDDLQWSDVNTINVLSYLVSGISDSRIMILGTFRSEELESAEGESHPLVDIIARYTGKPGFRRIDLGRLDKSACGQIVNECFPNAPFVEDLTENVYLKSEGNPFFIFEILNLLYDEGRVGFIDGQWEMRGESVEVEIPSSLRDIVAFRLEKLSETERDTLEAASIIGYRFTSDLLGQITDTPRIKLLRVLQKLEKNRRLIVCHEAGYRFDHHVVYETVYNGIIPELRTEYHRLTADLISAVDGQYPQVYNLVYHLQRAGEDMKLLQNLPVACARARSEYSNRLAMEYAEWAWDSFIRLGKPDDFIPLVADLMGQRSEVAGLLGERDIQLTSAAEMLELATQINDSAMVSEAYRLLGDHARVTSNWDLALEKLNLAYETCPVERGTECASILRQIGATYYFRGDIGSAIEYYNRALGALEGSVPGSELVLVHNNLGISLKRARKIEEAIREFETALNIADEIGDLHSETFPLGSLALINYDEGKWEKAHELFMKLLNILEQTGDVTSIARTLLNIGNIFYQVGMYEQAEDYFNESLKARRNMGHRSGEAIVLHHLAHIDIERGRFDEALDRLTEAMAIHQEIGAKRSEAGTLAVLARVNNLAGRPKIANECAIEGIKISEEGGFASRLLEARLESFIARMGLGESCEDIAGEVKKVVDDSAIEILTQQGPKALLRLGVLLQDCRMHDEHARAVDSARNLVEKRLDHLTDPEWRASYKLQYQGIAG